MKKTNKTFKRFAAITSASLLAACAMAPVFTSMTSYAEGEQAIDFTLSAPSLPEGAAIQEDVSAYELFKILVDNESIGVLNLGLGSEDAFVDGCRFFTMLRMTRGEYDGRSKRRRTIFARKNHGTAL